MDGVKNIGKNIYFYTDISDESTLELISIMEDLKDKETELFLHINSGGGLAQDGFHLYNYIKNYPLPVWGIVEGRCYSAAFDMFLGCDIRELEKYSLVMTHQISYGVEGYQNHSKFLSIIEEGEKLSQSGLDIFTKEVKVKNPEEFVLREHYLNDKDCKKLNITGVKKSFQKKVDLLKEKD